MRGSFFLFFLLSYLYCFSQNDMSYKNSIDSVLLSRTKSRVKKIRITIDTLNVRYFFTKKNDSLALIEIIDRNGRDSWVYNFHYINGQLAMLSKDNNRKSKDERFASAFYYFNNEKVVHKEENKTVVEDLHQLLHLAGKLKNKGRSLL